MTTFDDVTRSFTEGLSHILNNIPRIIDNFQHADNQFREDKNDLIAGYQVDFHGKGATMFAQAVENNIQIASRLQEKLREFVTDSDHMYQKIQGFNQQYGDQINNFSAVVLDDTGLRYYELSAADVINQLRDDTLGSYYDLGGVLDLGPNYLSSTVNDIKEGIWSYIQYRFSQNMDAYQQNYNHLIGRNPYAKSQYQQILGQQKQDEQNYLTQAQYELEQIYKNTASAMADWYNAVAGQVGIYNDQIAWAAATGQVSVGELLQDLVHAPGNAPLVIYQTKDGLVVAVNDINKQGLNAQQKALLIQKAIAEYALLNGLTNPKVTILGYQGGNDVVQELAHDKNPFQITNVVLIGAKITRPPAPGINYSDFVAPQDNNAGTGNPSLIPENASDWATVGIDAGEIVLGTATGPEGAFVATGEVITSTAVPLVLNSNTPNVSGAANNGMYFQTPPSLSPNQTLASDNLYALPDEPGEASSHWGVSSHFPFFRVKSIHYDQSTFLNMVGLADPTTGQPLKGFEPISQPTYYVLP